jgi:hypothetical protein
MSGVLKSISKVFISPISSLIGGKVGKIIKKVAIGALAVGAVVLTGGAALGILPALGTVVGGLGLSAGLTSVLTGAISSGAIGAVGGLLTGGFKGMTKGLLMGAVTGGVLGGIGAIGANGVLGGGKAVAGAATDALTSVGPSFASAAAPATSFGTGIAPAGFDVLSSVGPSFASAAAPAVSGAGASVASLGSGAAAIPLYGAGGAASSAGGLFGGNNLLASQLLGGISQAMSPNEYKQKYGAEAEAAREQSFFAYGGGDANGTKKGGITPGVYSNGDAFDLKSYGAPPTIQPGNYYTPPTKRWVYDPTTSSVVERPVGG